MKTTGLFLQPSGVLYGVELGPILFIVCLAIPPIIHIDKTIGNEDNESPSKKWALINNYLITPLKKN